jgi:hypothetical protein
VAAAEVPRAPVPALRRRRSAARASARRAAALGLLLLAAGCARDERSWPDGTPRFAGGLTLVGGERDGPWRFHYPDGALREEGRYDDGRRVGTWRTWHRNGQLASQGERRWNDATSASEREGPWEFWRDDGSPSARGAYGAGLREGEWAVFDEEGALVEKESGRYAGGRRVE